VTTSSTSTRSRREFLADAGILIVGFTLFPRGIRAESLGQAVGQLTAPSADALDSWLVIGRDDAVTVYAGKVELGTGVSTALRQIVAEELDVAPSRIAWVQGDSQLTVDQGRTVGSGSVKRGGAQLRRAAAEARQALLEMASAKLKAPVTQLEINDGVVSVTGDASRRLTFGALVGGGRFERTISGRAPLKAPSEYKVVGHPVSRVEIPAKVTGKHTYVHDVRLPGMVHGRVVRPPRVDATLQSVDESSVATLPGVIRVVRKGTFVGVVAEREEQAVRAAKALNAKWAAAPVLPDAADLYARFKSLATTERVVGENGDAASALHSAARPIRATYRWPFQLHASIGPSCAVADVRGNVATVYSSTQGAHQLVAPIAALLGMPSDSVRVVFTEGSGCYGHNGADDVAGDAALLSQAVGRPVRVQWSREDENAWEPEGPAMLFEMAGAVGADGKISAWTYDAWTPTHGARPTRDPTTLVAGALVAGFVSVGEFFSGGGERNARTTYVLPNERVTSHPVPSFPIRTSSLRGLGSPQNSFANESFMDELAVAAGIDPIEIRRRHLSDPRALAVIDAVAKRAGWTPRVSAPERSAVASNGVSNGRGFAYVQYDRTEAYVAAVADVDVRPDTGSVRVRRVCVAHDCGLIVNPDGLRNQIEGNVVQAISRTLKEAVRFDSMRVTGVDWNGYPILRFSEIPDAIDIDVIDHPDQPSVGAGEAATSPIPAAIANAIFDATGARVRQVPFTPDRVREALRASKV
jgi:CO/xanthine dehydrogenase Mo-binding subunit